MQTILKKHDYQVSLAALGEEGLTKAAAEQPDLINLMAHHEVNQMIIIDDFAIIDPIRFVMGLHSLHHGEI